MRLLEVPFASIELFGCFHLCNAMQLLVNSYPFQKEPDWKARPHASELCIPSCDGTPLLQHGACFRGLDAQRVAGGGTEMIDGVTLAYIMQSHRARFDAWYRNMSNFVFKPVKAQDTAPH
jgi:hypothetical protein